MQSRGRLTEFARPVAPALLRDLWNQGQRTSLRLAGKGEELFAHDLAVFHCVDSDLRHLHSFLGILVGHVDVVLHDEAVVSHEWSADFYAVDLHVLLKPLRLAAYLIDTAYRVSSASFQACLRQNSTTFSATSSVVIFPPLFNPVIHANIFSNLSSKTHLCFVL